MPRKLVDLTDQKFSKWTVLVRAENYKSGRTQRAMWLCVCDCGTEKAVIGDSLRSGLSRSCGCGNGGRKRAPRTKHRMTHTPEYRTYRRAKQRCENPNRQGYENYGGRGIKFLFTSFKQFYAELGPKPSPAHSVDRIDNDGHYEPGNVQWAIQSWQNRNQRRYTQEKKAA
jgi:hypothetical protein